MGFKQWTRRVLVALGPERPEWREHMVNHTQICLSKVTCWRKKIVNIQQFIARFKFCSLDRPEYAALRANSWAGLDALRIPLNLNVPCRLDSQECLSQARDYGRA